MPYARRMKALSIEGECKALIVTGLLGMPLGILIFLPFYHWPHDIFHVSSEVPTTVAPSNGRTPTLFPPSTGVHHDLRRGVSAYHLLRAPEADPS